jgi:DNA-binding MarR family transcriptional regulator
LLEPTADGFRNYFGSGLRRSPAEILVDRASLLSLTVSEMTVLVGGMRALDANTGQNANAVFTDRNGALSNVLWFLCRRPAPDGVPMGAVADGHLNRASDATRLADRLIALGYLERLSSPKDRRVVLVRVTAAGRDAFVRLTRRIKALHREQWKQLETAELRQLNLLLAKALRGEGTTGSVRHPLIADASSA